MCVLLMTSLAKRWRVISNIFWHTLLRWLLLLNDIPSGSCGDGEEDTALFFCFDALLTIISATLTTNVLTVATIGDSLMWIYGTIFAGLPVPATCRTATLGTSPILFIVLWDSLEQVFKPDLDCLANEHVILIRASVFNLSVVTLTALLIYRLSIILSTELKALSATSRISANVPGKYKLCFFFENEHRVRLHFLSFCHLCSCLS